MEPDPGFEVRARGGWLVVRCLRCGARNNRGRPRTHENRLLQEAMIRRWQWEHRCEGGEMRIEVTEDDIREGSPRACCSCPVARALNRALPPGCWSVRKDGLWNGRQGLFYRAPWLVKSFIKRFDAGESCKPFSFKLPPLRRR